MSWYNYLIVIIPFAIVLYMAFHTRKYIRGIPDFQAARTKSNEFDNSMVEWDIS